MSVTGHFWACHRGVTGLSQRCHPFFQLDAKHPENNIWHVTHMSIKCHQSVTKLPQVPPNGNSTSWWFKFCKNVQKGYFLWHFGNKSLTHLRYVQSYFLEVLHSVKKKWWLLCDSPVTPLGHAQKWPVTDMSQKLIFIKFIHNHQKTSLDMSLICHRNVTEMSQKSPWLSFSGEFLLKNSEFPSSFPIWGTLLSL